MGKLRNFMVLVAFLAGLELRVLETSTAGLSKIIAMTKTSDIKVVLVAYSPNCPHC